MTNRILEEVDRMPQGPAQLGEAVQFVTLTDLSKSAGEIIDAVAKDGVTAVVLKRGQFTAIIQKLDPDRVRDLLVAGLPDLISGRDLAEDFLRSGKARSTEYLAKDLEIDLNEPPR
jgi:hypothetical protein